MLSILSTLSIFANIAHSTTGERQLSGDVCGVHWQKEDVPAHPKATPTKASVCSLREGRLGVGG